jgi:hypothetical protein
VWVELRDWKAHIQQEHRVPPGPMELANNAEDFKDHVLRVLPANFSQFEAVISRSPACLEPAHTPERRAPISALEIRKLNIVRGVGTDHLRALKEHKIFRRRNILQSTRTGNQILTVSSRRTSNTHTETVPIYVSKTPTGAFKASHINWRQRFMFGGKGVTYRSQRFLLLTGYKVTNGGRELRQKDLESATKAKKHDRETSNIEYPI